MENFDIKKYKEIAIAAENESISKKEDDIKKRAALASDILEQGELDIEQIQELSKIVKYIENRREDIDASKGAMEIIEEWENGTWKEKYEVEEFDDLHARDAMRVCGDIMRAIEELRSVEAKIYAHYITKDIPEVAFKHGHRYRVSDDCKSNTGLAIEELESKMVETINNSRGITIEEVAEVVSTVKQTDRDSALMGITEETQKGSKGNEER